MTHHRLLPTCLLPLILLSLAACSVQVSQTPDDEAAIRAASADWSKATQAKDLDKVMSFYANDARVFSPKVPMVQGKDNIRKGWQQMLALPGPGLTFTTSGVEVAHSGDLAWEYGAYDFETVGTKADITVEKGKYVTIWKKQPDNAWRVAADSTSPDS